MFENLIGPISDSIAVVIPRFNLDQVVVLFFSLVWLMGISGIFGDDEEDEDMEGEMMFDDEDEEGGGMDDELEMDEDIGGLDDMGGMDDELEMDEEGGDMGDDLMGGGGSTAELENRVEELEQDVAELSSTVSTVRSENEEIGNEVDELEDNVQKLLDIYEMVTRGVNPFVDEAEAGSPFDDEDGSLDLFDTDDDDDDDEDEELDEDVSSADAESFFDEDSIDDDSESDFDAFESGDESDDDGEDSKSFDELKQEYESGEADWDTEGDEGEVDDESIETDVSDDIAFGEGDSEEEEESDDVFDAADDVDLSELEEDIDEAPHESDITDDGIDMDESDEGEESDSHDIEDEVKRSVPASVSDALVSDGTKPYLKSVPDGYFAELIIMKWMEFICESVEDDINGIATINFYKEVGWITKDVSDHLETIYLGIADIGSSNMDTDQSKRYDINITEFRWGQDEKRLVELGNERGIKGLSVPINTHVKSLFYISIIAGGTPEYLVMNSLFSDDGFFDTLGGDSFDGI